MSNTNQEHKGYGNNIGGNQTITNNNITNNNYSSRENEQKLSELMNQSFEELITKLIDDHQKNLKKIAEDSPKVADSLTEAKKTLLSKEATDTSIKQKRKLLAQKIKQLSEEVKNINETIASNLKDSLEGITDNISAQDLAIIDDTIFQLNNVANKIERESEDRIEKENIESTSIEPIWYLI